MGILSQLFHQYLGVFTKHIYLLVLFSYLSWSNKFLALTSNSTVLLIFHTFAIFYYVDISGTSSVVLKFMKH